MNNRYTIGKFGFISEVKKGFVRVSFEDDGIVSAWLPVMVQRSLNDKASWPFEIKEHVFCMMDEHLEYGIVQGAIYSDEDEPDDDEGTGRFRKLFSDGSFIEYDKNTHVLTANIQGKIKAIATDDIEATTDTEIKATATVKITCTAPNIKLDGDVLITGDVVAQKTILATDTITSNADVITGLIHLKTHKHSGVVSGGAISGTPVP